MDSDLPVTNAGVPIQALVGVNTLAAAVFDGARSQKGSVLRLLLLGMAEGELHPAPSHVDPKRT